MDQDKKFRWWIPSTAGWVFLLLVTPGIALPLGVIALLVIAADAGASRRGISIRGVLAYKLRRLFRR